MAQFIKGTKDGDIIGQDGLPNLEIRSLAGDDQIFLVGGGNVVDAGTGSDFVSSNLEGDNIIRLGKGDDLYQGAALSSSGGRDQVDGGAGNDQFNVQTFKSIYDGGGGNDVFVSDGRKNMIDGGKGVDSVVYATFQGATGVVIDLSIDAVRTGAGARRVETVVSIENAGGSLLADTITGSDEDNLLGGFDGADTLRGLDGNDTLEGGLDADLLSGEGGADLFFFRNITDSLVGTPDVILDFSSAEGDKIDLTAIDLNGVASFIGDSGFTGNGNAEIRLAGGFVTVDANGDAIADMEILTSLATMSAADFLV